MGGDKEKSIIEKFLEDNVLFLGPDPAIMEDHSVVPTTAREAAALAAFTDTDQINLVRHKLQTACNESFDMVEQMGAEPGAKWCDLISGVWTANGDLAMASMGPSLTIASSAEKANGSAAWGRVSEQVYTEMKWEGYGLTSDFGVVQGTRGGRLQPSWACGS